MEGIYRTVEAEEGLGMPQGSLAPTAPEAAEQVAPEGSGVAELGSSRAAPAAATPGAVASGVANREAPSGVVPTEEGPRTTPNTAARMPRAARCLRLYLQLTLPQELRSWKLPGLSCMMKSKGLWMKGAGSHARTSASNKNNSDSPKTPSSYKEDQAPCRTDAISVACSQEQ